MPSVRRMPLLLSTWRTISSGVTSRFGRWIPTAPTAPWTAPSCLNPTADWAGLACANEVAWLLDSLTQVYVHTGDARMRYYLRGLMQRWLALYQPYYRNSIAD